MLQLNSQNVHNIFLSSLFTGQPSAEDLKRAKYVDSVVLHVGFDSAKLEKNRDSIIELLEQLPKEFRENEGGGLSFLYGCMLDDFESQWGEQLRVDELVALGIGIDMVEFNLPRELWTALPGGVPYFYIKDSRENQ